VAIREELMIATKSGKILRLDLSKVIQYLSLEINTPRYEIYN